jgi:hypothetical protein
MKEDRRVDKAYCDFGFQGFAGFLRYIPDSEDGRTFFQKAFEAEVLLHLGEWLGPFETDALPRSAQLELKKRIDEMDDVSKLIMALRYGLGDAASLMRKIYRDEAKESDRRTRAITAAAIANPRPPRRLIVIEEQPVPERYLSP